MRRRVPDNTKARRGTGLFDRPLDWTHHPRDRRQDYERTQMFRLSALLAASCLAGSAGAGSHSLPRLGQHQKRRSLGFLLLSPSPLTTGGSPTRPPPRCLPNTVCTGRSSSTRATVGRPGYLTLDRSEHNSGRRATRSAVTPSATRISPRSPMTRSSARSAKTATPCWAGAFRCATSPIRSVTSPPKSARSSPTAATTALATSEG